LEALEDYRDLPLARHAHTELMPRAFGLRFNFTAADAMYVALAEILDAALLTADHALAKSASAHTRLSVLKV
jgi:predicted nucleic acid-binding protein